MIERSAFFRLPARQLSGRPDVIQYRLKIEDAAREHEVTFDDERADEDLRSLVDRLLRSDAG